MVVAQACDPTHHLGGDEWETSFNYMTRLVSSDIRACPQEKKTKKLYHNVKK